jgi:nickel/cobalt transporter (NicO) family protein
VRRAAILIAFAAALLVPSFASAHPLGNFTVNRYTELRLSGESVYVHYVLDLAEIPTFQEGDRVRRQEFARQLAGRLVVRLDGDRAQLRLLARKISSRRGAGGLPTLRFEAVYAARAHGTRLAYRDEAFAGRIGWREIVAVAGEGARIEASSVPDTGVSRALRMYPRDLLQSPLDVQSARVRFEPGEGTGVPPQLGNALKPDSPRRLAAVVSGDLSLGFVLASLALALFWGAAHALGPGHGKAIVAGYLVGSRGRLRDAFALGAIVTVTHTLGVFALGAVTLALSAFVVPEQLYPWLNLISALLVVGVGTSVLRIRLSESRHARAHAQGGEHEHHDHGHGRGQGAGVRGLVGVGISGGILPCPTALVVLLAAISLHRVGYGLVLVAAFSVGLAASVTGIGLVAVIARNAFARLRLDGRAIRLLPAVSAAAVLALGLTMTLRALPGVV